MASQLRTADSSLLSSVIEWEERESLFEHRVDSIPLWRLVRNVVLDKHLDQERVRDPSNHNRFPLRRCATLLSNIVRSVVHLSRIRRSQYLIIGFPRRRLEFNTWKDHFSDPIIDVLGPDTTLCIEKPFVGEHCRPPYTQHIAYYDWVMAVSKILSQILCRLPNQGSINPARALARSISQHCHMRESAIMRLIVRSMIAFRIETAMARWYLRRIRPRCMFITSRWVHLALIHAARRENINVIELQHGVPNPDSFKYRTNFDSAVDPDWFASFGSFWNDVHWGVPREHVVSVGYRYIWDRRQNMATSASKDGDIVMLVTQPEMWSRLSPMFEAIVNAYPTTKFMLKLHPQDVQNWQSRYPFGAKNNVEVEADFRVDLYSLFERCSVVLGYNSTVLFESSFFGRKTAILNFDGLNRCPALQFTGQFNFFEINTTTDFSGVLSSTPHDTDLELHPFFMKFDEKRLLELTSQ